MKIYLVGGAVRDLLLNRPILEKDWVVVGATVEEMLAQNYQPVGKDFPVFLHPTTKEEYALARTERKTGKGYTQFSFYTDTSVTLNDDLLRRDLTINAMAIAKEDVKNLYLNNQTQREQLISKIIDPFHGQQDLKNKILRHVSPAFAEDPVRILRIARFAARFGDLGFNIHPNTFILMRQMVRNGEVDALVAERVWQEFTTALMETQPEQFFHTLRRCGALEKLFPQLDQLFGVPLDPKHHPEIDSGEHVLLALSRAAKLDCTDAVRFAAMLQMVGNNCTHAQDWPQHSESNTLGDKLIKQLCKHYKVSSEFRDLAILVNKYHGKVYQSFQLSAEQLLDLLEQTDAFRRPRRFDQFLQACLMNCCEFFQETSRDFPQIEFLLNILNATKQISAEQFIESGLQGNEIKKALQTQRISIISDMLSNQK